MTIRSCVHYLLVVTVRPFNLCFNMSVFKALAGAVTINLIVFCTMTIKAFEFEFEFKHSVCVSIPNGSIINKKLSSFCQSPDFSAQTKALLEQNEELGKQLGELKRKLEDQTTVRTV